MEDTKPWYTSKTIWASLCQLVVGIAVATGVVSSASGVEAQTQFPEIMVGVTTSLLALVGFVGRIVATRQLGG